jgi:tetratricopeptide (TPR) repeat protein
MLGQLCNVADLREDDAAAVDYTRQALEVAMDSGNVRGACVSITDLEWLEDGEGFDPATEKAIKRSIDWLTEHEAVSDAADAAMLLGEIARRRSRFEEATHFYERAREVSQKNGHDAGTARAFGALGLLRMGEKDYDHAEWYFTTASSLYEKLGSQGNSARMLERCGWNFYLKGDRDAAGAQWGRALARYANVGMHTAARKLREGMAKAGVS